MTAPSTPTHAITFPSHGAACAAWHVPATTDALAGPRGRPCAVMAHGFGATRDSGLLSFARPFADAGLDSLVFDYRGFGDSTGTPRQHVTFRRQREDYHAVSTPPATCPTSTAIGSPCGAPPTPAVTSSP